MPLISIDFVFLFKTPFFFLIVLHEDLRVFVKLSCVSVHILLLMLTTVKPGYIELQGDHAVVRYIDNSKLFDDSAHH